MCPLVKPIRLIPGAGCTANPNSPNCLAGKGRKQILAVCMWRGVGRGCLSSKVLFRKQIYTQDTELDPDPSYSALGFGKRKAPCEPSSQGGLLGRGGTLLRRICIGRSLGDGQTRTPLCRVHSPAASPSPATTLIGVGTGCDCGSKRETLSWCHG